MSAGFCVLLELERSRSSAVSHADQHHVYPSLGADQLLTRDWCMVCDRDTKTVPFNA